MNLQKISRALISVFDKTGLENLGQALMRHQVEIVSTGGTAKALRAMGVTVREVSDVTGFPEILGGRVKTIHPMLAGGILARRDNTEDMKQVAEHNLPLIDLVVVNLYPFSETSKKQGIAVEEMVEQIDIGGPSLLRAAAKNYEHVAAVVDPTFYPKIIAELNANDGALSLATRQGLFLEVFLQTSEFDEVVNEYFDRKFPLFQI